MATLATNKLTLKDHMGRMDPDGALSAVAEMMNQYNEVLDDMPLVEGNLPTGHKTTIRTGLPNTAWRILNYGVQPTKSTTSQQTETCGMLEGYSEVDKDIADLNGNTADFRTTEDAAFIESMAQNLSSNLFYGNINTSPERIMGFAPRFNTVNTANAANAVNVIDAGGTGSVNTSIWLVVWGKLTVHAIFPKGSKAGLLREDKGQVTLQDGNGGNYEGYRTHYQQKIGLTVRDWRYVVRICNIDTTALATAGDASDTSANLLKLMIKAYNQVPSMSLGAPVYYMNNQVKSMLQVKLMNKSNVYLTQDSLPNGMPLTRFNAVPCRRVDQILNTEARVV